MGGGQQEQLAWVATDIKVLDAMISYAKFNVLYGINQVLLVTALALVATWMAAFGGGFGWQERPDLEFRWHPLAMSLGMLFCNGEAILIYRGLRNVSKPRTKLAHAAIQFVAILILIFGLKAAWDSHDLNKDKDGNPKPIPNLMSLHSWIGITTVVLFCSQFVFGFVTYLKPGLPLEYRAVFMPAHRLTGISLFVMALGSALLGISERAAWKMTCWTKEGYFCGEMLITNFFGVCLVAYALTTIVLVTYPDWIRVEQAEPVDTEQSVSVLYYIFFNTTDIDDAFLSEKDRIGFSFAGAVCALSYLNKISIVLILCGLSIESRWIVMPVFWAQVSCLVFSLSQLAYCSFSIIVAPNPVEGDIFDNWLSWIMLSGSSCLLAYQIRVFCDLTMSVNEEREIDVDHRLDVLKERYPREKWSTVIAAIFVVVITEHIKWIFLQDKETNYTNHFDFEEPAKMICFFNNFSIFFISVGVLTEIRWLVATMSWVQAFCMIPSFGQITKCVFMIVHAEKTIQRFTKYGYITKDFDLAQ